MPAKTVLAPTDLDTEFNATGPKVTLKTQSPLYKDPATGAIGVALTASTKQFLQVYLTGANRLIRNTTSIAGVLLFNAQAAANGIAYNVTTGAATLTGGKPYRITVTLHCNAFSANAAYAVVNIVDAATRAPVSPVPPMEIHSNIYLVALASPQTLELIYTPTANQEIAIRCTDAGGQLYLRADAYSGLIIQEL